MNTCLNFVSDDSCGFLIVGQISDKNFIHELLSENWHALSWISVLARRVYCPTPNFRRSITSVHRLLVLVMRCYSAAHTLFGLPQYRGHVIAANRGCRHAARSCFVCRFRVSCTMASLNRIVPSRTRIMVDGFSSGVCVCSDEHMAFWD